MRRDQSIRRSDARVVVLGALLLFAGTACDARRAAGNANDAQQSRNGPTAGEHWAIGTPATSARIAQWETDVGPDGADLPPGRGSVADGEKLFQRTCAACHGANGEGKATPPYPALIGRDPKAEKFVFATDPKLVKTIGNYWPYAYTLFDYVRRAMPHGNAGSLTNDEVYALTAYLLSANGVIGKDTMLDAASLRRVKMPYADRFVPDNRTGGPTVK